MIKENNEKIELNKWAKIGKFVGNVGKGLGTLVFLVVSVSTLKKK